MRIVDYDVNFFIFSSATEISYRCDLLIIKGSNMLVNGSFDDFSHLYRIGQDRVIHENGVLDSGIGNIYLRAGF